ncbi:MAG TPA: NAD-dependent epimerase/dehydratase family protein [Ferruginibacter sp.]|nr:NAD-dependent epimerase/dehydratase family protein [Ferruginibacter sp.]
MKYKIILTGVTGMVGEGVLHECLQHPSIEQVLIINRNPSGISNPKIKEIIHTDFNNISPIAGKLAGYDACLFCLGVSAVGMTEEDYTRLTYTLTLHVAKTMVQQNPGMTFCYISGAGTDSTEKGRMMWARVKGKTENDLLKLPFKQVYLFRPGYMNPTKGMKNTLKYYKYISWMYPALRMFFPKYVSTLSELGRAMINAVIFGYPKPVLEVKDIVALANKAS